MTNLDRDQIRRDAERFVPITDNTPTTSLQARANQLARHCLTLLDELEQAERERDHAKTAFDRWIADTYRERAESA